MKFTSTTSPSAVAAAAAATLLSLANVASAHSWVERINMIRDGKLSADEFGYPRGPVPRSAGWTDIQSEWRLDETNDGKVFSFREGRRMCHHPESRQDGQVLDAAPGDWVALRYLENGHVTNPQEPPGKPKNSGTVFIYATDQPRDDDEFLKIHRVWNAAGTGGDRRGRLLATRKYDDGQCYEVNPFPISQERQQLFPHETDALMGPHVWCQNDVQIPEDWSAGSITLYWVWDWTTLEPQLMDSDSYPFQGEGVLQVQTYSSCMKVNVAPPSVRARGAGEGTDARAERRQQFDAQTAVVGEQLENAFLIDYGDLTANAGTPSPPENDDDNESVEEPESSPAPTSTQLRPTDVVSPPATVTVTQVITQKTTETDTVTEVVTPSPSPSPSTDSTFTTTTEYVMETVTVTRTSDTSAAAETSSTTAFARRHARAFP